MTEATLLCALEAILFASGEPIAPEKIGEALGLETSYVDTLLKKLQQEYDATERGIQLLELEGSFQLATREAYDKQVRTVLALRRNTPLSPAAMEVLAVVAYNQPVTKAFLEQVRGVDCSGVVASLLQKGLLEERGRLELPGRPLLYGTTANFLRCMGLSSLEELPEPQQSPVPEQLKLE